MAIYIFFSSRPSRKDLDELNRGGGVTSGGGAMAKLRDLNVSFNSLRCLATLTPSTVPNLTHLNASHNSLKSNALERFLFGTGTAAAAAAAASTRNLKVLKLNHNAIATLKGLRGGGGGGGGEDIVTGAGVAPPPLPFLEELWLGHNKLVDLEDAMSALAESCPGLRRRGGGPFRFMHPALVIVIV